MDPLRQQQLAMPTVEVFLSIEEQLLINIAKQLSKHGSLLTEDNIVSWQTEQLAMLGQLTQQNIITIAKHSGKTVNEVTKALEEAGYGAVEEFEGTLQEAVAMGLLISPHSIVASQALQDVLSTYQAQALDTFNLINTTLLKQSEQVFLDVVNQTVGKVLAGTQTPQEALRDAVRMWAEKGVPSLIDKAGKRWSTEAYLNMVMRTTVNNVANDMQFARMDDFNVDLVEISSHLGARPRCAPFQGRIFSRSGKSRKYPALSSTSFGEAAGLKGVNCNHIFYPYIEGFSKKAYHPYEESENKKAYEESQNQRYLERKIRNAKRQLQIMETLGDNEGIEAAKRIIRSRQADMREFINSTNRSRRYDREQNIAEPTKEVIDSFRLPGYEQVNFPEAKLTKYALDPNGKAPDKAIAFEKALGYNLNNYKGLIENVLKNLSKYRAIPRGDKGYGETYQVVMNLIGPNGKNANVLTAWVVDSNSGETRLTSIYVTNKKG
jgi:hypothetical protein